MKPARDVHHDSRQADGTLRRHHELVAADGTPEPELDTTYPED